MQGRAVLIIPRAPPQCNRATCTVYIQLAVAQLSRAQFTAVRDEVGRQQQNGPQASACAALHAFSDHLIYPSPGEGVAPASMRGQEPLSSPPPAAGQPAPGSASSTATLSTSLAPSSSVLAPRSFSSGTLSASRSSSSATLPFPRSSSSATLSASPPPLVAVPASLWSAPAGTKRAASQDLPFHRKRACRGQDGGGPATVDAGLRQTLSHLEQMIDISKTWPKQHEMLTIFLTSSPAPSLSSTAVPQPSPDPTRQFPSDATVPCTYPDDEPTSPVPAVDDHYPDTSTTASALPWTTPGGLGRLGPDAGLNVHLDDFGSLDDSESEADPNNPWHTVRPLLKAWDEAGKHPNPETAKEARQTVR